MTRRARRLRRAVQGLGLLLLLAPLASAQFGGRAALPWPPDLMARLDPLIALATAVAARALTWVLLPGLALLAMSPLIGRAFCGWLCPLGATIDASDAILAPRAPVPPSPWRNARWPLLAALLGAALLGASLLHLAAPLSLAGRIYAVALLPLAAKAARLGLDAGRPLVEALDLRPLLFAEFKSGLPRTFPWAMALGALLLAASRASPRWWCRNLCPAGALLGLCALLRAPVWRRGVSHACIRCGRCQTACPMAAIPPDAQGGPHATSHADCTLCRTCAGACPVEAIEFPFEWRGRENQGGEGTAGADAPLRSGESGSDAEGAGTPSGIIGRRELLAGAVGLAGAGVLRMSGSTAAAPDHLPVRPPGSVPEPEFLSRCMRCGLCVAACPTQVLQPLWLWHGAEAAFSPAMRPVGGFCDPRCHACGRTCPTAAIRPLGEAERIWAKVGAAAVKRKLCLAWEQRKKCLVCDETCPYDAIQLRPEPGNPVHVPHVDESRCAGCGYCERHCPVAGAKAIVVEARGAIRLAHGSPQAAARAKGLDLSLRPQPKSQDGPPQDVAPGGLPPGFSE